MYFNFPTTSEAFAFYTEYVPGNILALSEEECDLLIEQAKEVGFVTLSPEDGDASAADVHELPASVEWGDRLWPLLDGANKTWWRFDIGMIRYLNVLCLSAPNQCHQHTDLKFNAQNRKLSLVAMLSDPEDYEGGDLQIMVNSEFVSVTKERGTVVVFPAFTLHRVTRVTAGERWTLATWVEGPPFR